MLRRSCMVVADFARCSQSFKTCSFPRFGIVFDRYAGFLIVLLIVGLCYLVGFYLTFSFEELPIRTCLVIPFAQLAVTDRLWFQVVSNVQSVMEQQYTGDITIVPRIRLQDYLNIVNNPTPEYLRHSQQIGQLTAWKRKAWGGC